MLDLEVHIAWMLTYSLLTLQLDTPILEALTLCWRPYYVAAHTYYLAIHGRGTFDWNQCRNPDTLILIMRVNGRGLRHVEVCERYLEVCVAAVTCTPDALAYVQVRALSSEQYHYLCLTAVQHAGWCLPWVDASHLTAPAYYEIQLAAVRHWGIALNYISEFGSMFNTEPNATWHTVDAELTWAAVHSSAFALRYVKEPTLELCQVAVQRDRRALKYVPAHLLPLLSN